MNKYYEDLKQELDNLYTKFKDCKYKNRNCVSLNRINHPKSTDLKDYYLKNVSFLIVKKTNFELDTVSFKLYFQWENRQTFLEFLFGKDVRFEPTEDSVEYIRQLNKQLDIFNETCDHVNTLTEQIKDYCEEKELELPFAINVFQSVLDGKDNDY